MGWFYDDMWRPGGRFQQILEEKSNGRFKLEVRRQLFPRREVHTAISEGRAQIGEMRAPWISGTFPLFDIGALPFWWGGAYEWEAFNNDPRMVEIWDDYYRKIGLVKLGTFISSPNEIIWGHKPVDSLDDLAGLKVRTSGAIQTEAMRALGASPLTIPGPEIAEAVARGTVDGVLTGREFGIVQGMPELTEYMSLWAGFTPVFEVPLIANAEAFDGLPPDLRDALVAAAQEMQRQEMYASDATIKGIDIILRAIGKDFVYPPDEELEKAKELTIPVIEDWIETAAPLGEKVLNISREYASGAR